MNEPGYIVFLDAERRNFFKSALGTAQIPVTHTTPEMTRPIDGGLQIPLYKVDFSKIERKKYVDFVFMLSKRKKILASKLDEMIRNSGLTINAKGTIAIKTGRTP